MNPAPLRLAALAFLLAALLAATAADGNHWHVSTYYASNLNGHGPGNRAMWCGDSTLASCAPWDSVGGVVHNMFDDLVWSRAVADPDAPVTVNVTAWLNYDLPDETWDWLELIVRRGDQEEIAVAYTGPENDGVHLDHTTVVQPADFTGAQGDRVQLMLRVRSDGAWDDEDCFMVGHGAAQVDDITVRFDGVPVTFDDFEEGSPVHWRRIEDVSGVGDPPAAADLAVSAAPNPFNPKVRIAFWMPAAGAVSVVIYDPAGRLVRTLPVGDQPAGRCAVTWDGRDEAGAEVASGSYLYRVVAGADAAVGKVALVR